MTPTIITSGTQITASPTASVATASVSPAHNAVLLLAVGVSKASGSPNVTVSGLGLTWTSLTAQAVRAIGSDGGVTPIHGTWLFWAQGTVTPGTITISIGSTGTSTGWAWILASVDDVAAGSGSSLFDVLTADLGTESLSLAVNPLARSGNARFAVVGSTAAVTTSTDIAGLTVIGSVAHAAPAGFLAMGWRATGNETIRADDTDIIGLAIISAEMNGSRWPENLASGAQS